VGAVLRLLLRRWLAEPASQVVAWSDMDLDDPERPRLRVTRAELGRGASGRRGRRRRAG
jgi:hypothetical protein